MAGPSAEPLQQTAASSKNPLRLGYLRIISPRPNCYIGGLMITDARGLPLSFNYTEPIQPTKLQQVLYGAALTPYLKRDVILQTLCKTLESKPIESFSSAATAQPIAILVQDDALVGYTPASNPRQALPIIRISETNTAPLGAPGTWQSMTETEGLLQISVGASPVRILHPFDPIQQTESAPATAQTAEAGALKETGLPKALLELLKTGSTMPVAEPLTRLERALETLLQEANLEQDPQEEAS
ncbi:MAG: hypothetical protein VKJ06_02535 [Vampirovibrionales bacterium]|nr:hypothetical protein [Vampirovibrionales bacterium]